MTKNQLADAPGPGSPNQGFAFPVDQIGVWTSTACAIHCLLTPVVLSISTVSAHFLPSEEKLIAPLQWPLPRLEPLH
jgi:MerC mercury resistance protein